MKIRFPYGKSFVIADIPDKNLISPPEPKPLRSVDDPHEAVEHALDHPVSKESLDKIAGQTSKVCLVISDITRPIPNKTILPPIIERLKTAGVSADNLVLAVGSGSHRPQSSDELAEMLGQEILGKFKVVAHNCVEKEKMVDIGKTSQGTHVALNKVVADADIRVLTGLIEPHNLSGFSGGRKSILPGVSSIETITENHSSDKLDNPKCVAGVLEGNLIHEDMEEAAKMVGVDFILNIVSNFDGNIAKVVCGDLVKAHREGVSCCYDASKVVVPEPADTVIVASGYPWDQNLYMTINGPNRIVHSPKPVLRKGGTIIVVAECSEGVGKAHAPFYELLTKSSSIDDVLAKTCNPDFFIKDKWEAHLWARILERYEVVVVTGGITANELKKAFMRRASSLDEAVEYALDKHGPDAKILSLQNAIKVIPMLA